MYIYLVEDSHLISCYIKTVELKFIRGAKALGANFRAKRKLALHYKHKQSHSSLSTVKTLL